jgi:hypothetical protein
VPPTPLRIIVLYSHPVLGEGLGRIIATEPDVEVTAVDLAAADEVEAAIASDPALIVVEEGGRLDAIDILRRARCPVIVDVDITSPDAWTLRRDHIAAGPEAVLEAIRAALHPARAS